ncbi:50S ribosomal protein L31 type B [Thiomicrospira sp. XS5]|jgi:large subunit ribosomal protein L31|uniref:Large ribosomal subunit protein bL31B n=4 Tax=Gammaproteobacteria TaxID=1236 RepID=RL31B_HYDCU|nr:MULTISPECIES: type B 50S ribosomal protein L31 [Piscirickettsiaceae]Q31JF2.1 RecName: Full=Large ribosomal subunit protein bL31B; AltName: Full=50S ribosomal protein L31 type B [Hydrogenovibrio crunogenus XCL-2]RUM90840.1 MAG: type B 50S ribosomal protein L31 [Thiomicrospira sp.]AZR83060.1 50S ribosomal protein L31 [Thiomicrospira sp. S5]KUJ74284.1 50S ribosomal protein L31 type B [Thiomicrospira sp. XS5]MDG4813310.1 type B 50S ribosomal protein L31 [Hydrogenovibrio sp. 3SP14C1]QAB14330.1 
MQAGIHPEYNEVVFQDISTGETFLTRSTIEKTSGDTITLDGKEYPLVRIEVSSASHPFFTGKQSLVDTEGRVEKFRQKYGMRK